MVPSQFSAFAMFGGVDLDLREAKFETPEVRITAVAICGGIDIKVSPEVVVQVEGAGIFGGFGRPGMLRRRLQVRRWYESTAWRFSAAST